MKKTVIGACLAVIVYFVFLHPYEYILMRHIFHPANFNKGHESAAQWLVADYSGKHGGIFVCNYTGWINHTLAPVDNVNYWTCMTSPNGNPK